MANVKFEAVFSHHEPGQSPVQENTHEVDLNRGLFLLVDGLGGVGVGDQVAELVATSVKKYLLKKSEDEEATMPFVLRKYYSLVGNVLFNALLYANQEVLKWNRGKNVHERGGASITACLLDGDYLAVAQVGSTEASLVRGEEVLPLTQSRTYGRSIGQVAGPQAELPLMAIGVTEDLEPEIWEYRVAVGDAIALQSGLGQRRLQLLDKIKELQGVELAQRLDRLQAWVKKKEAHSVPEVTHQNHSVLVAFVDAE